MNRISTQVIGLRDTPESENAVPVAANWLETAASEGRLDKIVEETDREYAAGEAHDRCAWKDDNGTRCKAQATCKVDVFGDRSCHPQSVWVEVGFCDEHTEIMNG